MSYRKINTWYTLDWLTIGIYLILVIAGWFSIYASSYDFDQVGMTDFSSRSGKQMIWIFASLLLGFLLLLIESDWYEVFAYWVYLIFILLLVVTLFLAKDIRGSHSWLELGPVSLQPAEFAKFATALAVAKRVASQNFNLTRPLDLLRALGLIFLPVALIILQKETGSALVFFAFFLVLYREGMSGFVLFAGFCAILFFVLQVRYGDVYWELTSLGEVVVLLLILLFSYILLYNYKKGRQNLKVMSIVSIVLLMAGFVVSRFVEFNLSWLLLGVIIVNLLLLLALYMKYRAGTYLLIILYAAGSIVFSYSLDYVFDEVLKPHQQIRIRVTLGMIDDPSGAGYNVNQSKIAIGSGGVTGKGFLNGTQTKLKYVPEQDTDFIFCTIGEEKGFLGTAAVMLAFLVFILRIIFLSERQKSTFNRVYGYCVASILFFHLLINIGMVIGITPVIGIPLPFFSYGGSSLWAFTLLLFVFLRLDASRKDRL